MNEKLQAELLVTLKLFFCRHELEKLVINQGSECHANLISGPIDFFNVIIFSSKQLHLGPQN